MRVLSMILPIGLSLCFAASAFAAVTRHVDLDDGEPNPPLSFDGSLGWDSDAYKYLQDALEDAGSGDIIFVSAGHHYPDKGLSQTEDDETATFLIPGGVTIYGGFEGVSEEDGPEDRDIFTHITILDGAIGSGLNSYHVVKIGGSVGTVVLNGLTITNGVADGSGSQQYVGGGLLASWDFAAVNCTFENNLATYQGGAVYIANVNAGGIFSNCVFRENTAASGGSDSGGAVAIEDGAGSVIFGTANFINCLFHDNFARVHGGAIWQGHGNTTTLTNCTLSQNSVAGGSSTVYLQLNSKLVVKNTIIWGNGSGGVPITYQTGLDDDSIIIQYSDIQSIPSGPPPAWYTDTTVVSVGPIFVDPSTNNFRLDSSSPLINAGGSVGIPDTYDVDDDDIKDGLTGEATPDLDLTVRIWCCTCPIDMGAYEFGDACAFDLDDDGDVDGFDMAILLGDWGSCPGGGCDGNFDCDEDVDGFDLAQLLGGWTFGEQYPRECDPGESSAMGGGLESEPDSAALDEVLAALGLENHDEFVVWLQLVGIQFAASEIEQILGE